MATYRAELGCGVIRVCKADPFCASPAVRAPLQPSDERTLRRRVRCCTVSGTELDVQRRQIARASRAPSRRASAKQAEVRRPFGAADNRRPTSCRQRQRGAQLRHVARCRVAPAAECGRHAPGEQVAIRIQHGRRPVLRGRCSGKQGLVLHFQRVDLRHQLGRLLRLLHFALTQRRLPSGHGAAGGRCEQSEHCRRHFGTMTEQNGGRRAPSNV